MEELRTVRENSHRYDYNSAIPLCLYIKITISEIETTFSKLCEVLRKDDINDRLLEDSPAFLGGIFYLNSYNYFHVVTI